MSAASQATRLQLLDGARWHGAPIPGERAATLLALLATAAPRAVSTSALIDRIWPDEIPAHPEKALQVLVSRVRSRTQPAVVVRTSSGYRLGLADDEVDILLLRSRLDAARAGHAAGDLEVARVAAADALAVGVAMAASGPLRALVEEAHRGQDRARRILGEAALARGDAATALPLLEAAHDRHPDDEDLLASVIRAEAEARGVPSALERWAAYAAHTRERVGAEPGPALQRLHTELLARDAPVRSGLQYDAGPLIGRDDDLAELRSLLHSHRVVTILGPGGLGKTRMAHLLGRLAAEPVVHLVELVGVRNGEDVLRRVAGQVGVGDSLTGRSGGAVRRTRAEMADLRARMAEQLGAPTLLILDNCEQVVEAVADLVGWLVAATDTVRVLTTSRAPLGISAEYAYPLPQLPLTDAVDLFSQRARAARPAARLDRDEVTALVSRLDGLPLAVELAAARVRVLSVADITRRLGDRFALLAAADHAGPERHRTIEAVIEWSWQLLTPVDQQALATMSVLPDGFGLDAAESVLGPDALARLVELVDQSLLDVHEDADGVRYRFLETIREFGMLRLARTGRAAVARDRVRTWARQWARAQGARLFSDDQIAAVDAIRVEAGNLVAELRSALDDRDAPSVAVLMGVLSGYWTIRGDHYAPMVHAAQVRELLRESPLPPESDRPLWRALVAGLIISATIFRTDPHAGDLTLLERLGSARDAGTADALREIALHGLDTDDSLAALARTGDDEVRRLALALLSQATENSGDIDGAIAIAHEALAMGPGPTGPWLRALTLANLCALTATVEGIQEAAAYAREALPVIEAVHAYGDAAQLRCLLALAAVVEDRLEEATAIVRDVETGEGGREDVGYDVIGSVAMVHGEIALARGDVDAGLAWFRDADTRAARATAQYVGVLSGTDFAAVGETPPWVQYAASVSVFAHAYRGVLDPARDQFARLSAIRIGTPDDKVRLDGPITGATLVSTGAWLLADRRDAANALDRIALGWTFGYPRYQPVFAWAHVREIVEREGFSLDDLDDRIAEFSRLGLAERFALAAGM